MRRLLLCLTALLPACASSSGGGASPSVKPATQTIGGDAGILTIANTVTADVSHLTFTPDAAKGGSTGQNALGQIEPDGSYELTTFNTGDGAILGQHVVTIQAYDDTDAFKPKADGTYSYKLPKPTIPVKYTKSDTTPLRSTVIEGVNKVDFELKD